jgi:hypothetical protein
VEAVVVVVPMAVLAGPVVFYLVTLQFLYLEAVVH